MSNNRDLLKEAIADAKAVKETAIANAKAALEEAFTPHLKSMLAAKLEEMDKDDVDEGYDKYEEDDVKMEEVNETEEVTEVEEIEEEINLDELLAELEEGEDKDEVKESEEIEKSEEVTEEEEVEAEESEDEEAEGEMEEEEVDLEDMTEDDLKSFIEDVIKDMVEAGELEAGEEMEDEMEADADMEGDMEIEVEDEEEEIMEDDAVSKKLKDGASLDSAPRKVGQSTVQEAEEEVTEGDPDAAARGLENIINFVIKNAKKGKDWLKKNVEKGSMQQAMTEMEIEEGDPDAAARGLENIVNFVIKNAEKGKDWIKKNVKMGSMQDAMASEALAEIEELKKELQEVNLLNAKLLYTNKIFKSKNLSEDKKVKVLKAFDKAATVKEAKVIFETLNEGISSKMTKPSINEVKGSASKATGITPKAKQPIVENAAFARMQKLAGIIKEN